MGQRIMIVDDDERVLQTLARYLRRAGYTVFTAGGGEEALQLFARERPEIVFADARMPHPDGYAVLQAIRRQTQETEVIMVTDQRDKEKAREATAAGASDSIPKPIEPRVLSMTLRHAQDRLRSRRAGVR